MEGLVFGVELPEEIASAIRKEVADLGATRLETGSARMGLQSVERAAEGVEMIVVGPDIAEPVQTAQRAFAIAPNLPILLLSDAKRFAEVRRALQFAPMVGEHVRCIAGNAQEIACALRETLERARRRARSTVVLSAVNARLAAPASSPTPAAEILGRILQYAPIGVIVVDGRGVIGALNPHAAQLLRTTERESLGQVLYDRFREPERGRAFIAAVSAGKSPVTVLSAGSAAEESRFEVSAAPFTGRDGAGGYVVILRDVTENERLVESLRAARTQAEEANRAKDGFLAMLGHELRNPLSPIVTALHLMQLKGGDPRFSREHSIIERQVRHLVRLVDDLLDISRITRGMVTLQRRPVEVSEIIGKGIEQASALLEQFAHRLDVKVPARGLLIDADPDRLAQVTSNLLTNAAKYTPAGGAISVIAERVDHQVVVRVRDTGVGLSPELLPHVFESFVQGKRDIDRSQGGLGLGLAIVRNLVSLHDGTVSARSPGPGLGSEFEFRLPSLDGAPESQPIGPVPGSASRVPARSAGTMRVLVVDDNVDAAVLLGSALDACGYRTRVVHDCVDAMNLVRDFQPDVAILDIGLPVMDGYELSRRLRDLVAPRSLKFVALTGYGQSEDRERSEAAGFAEHLVKPVDIATLQEVLERVR